MKVIHWFDLGQEKLPRSAKVLHCGLRDGAPVAWCEVERGDTEWKEVIRLPTGSDAPPEPFRHIGTVTGLQGWMVFHYYIKD